MTVSSPCAPAAAALPDAPAAAEAALPALELRHIGVRRGHGASAHLALDDVSLRLPRGSLGALIGPNGGGKSTLLAVAAGQLRPDAGQRLTDPALRVALLPQTSTLDRSFPLRVHELVAMGLWWRIGSLRGLTAALRQQVDEALATVGLTAQAQRLVGELSSGQLQRALFARLMLQDAGLILLDEPFNALDARTSADLLALLLRWRAEGRTVLAVLHDLATVRRHFDQVLLLAGRPLASGAPDAVLKPALLARAGLLAEGGARA